MIGIIVSPQDCEQMSYPAQIRNSSTAPEAKAPGTVVAARMRGDR
ncbi:hypothetical protein [Actinoplanes friuliensis]|nr:hypothetical protein [Actinoplanes friuliensis]